MSLILDALRRADSERERGSVPGLNAQPVPPPSLEPSTKQHIDPRHWIAASLLGALLIALAWMLFGRETSRSATASTTVQIPSAAAPATPPSPAVAPTAAPPLPTKSAAPVPEVKPSELPQVAEPAPWPTRETRKAPDTTVAAAAPPAQAAAQTPPSAAAPPAEPPIYTREQLPENVRAQLPQLAVGGSIYSPDPASRSVIINGRIYRESDRLTADLSLEQIKLNAAVLRFKGYRVEIHF